MPKPQGSAYDAWNKKRASRTLRRRIRSWITRPSVALAAWVFPHLYMAYCWLVWRTSTVEDAMTEPLTRALDQHDRFVGCLWHQEVFSVAYGYKHMRPHTLASTGNFGRIITRMLELCDFTVFRGGSSRGSSRRLRVVDDMIDHMQTTPRCVYGITVDGSYGPPYRLKKGSVVIARTCHAPLFAVRTWYARYFRLPTWDRTAIPLPFNRIRIYAVGPYWVDPEGGDAELDAAVAHLESELQDMTSLSFQHLESKPHGYAPAEFPDGWTPRWDPMRPGIKRTRWDLEPDDPPPWANANPNWAAATAASSSPHAASAREPGLDHGRATREV